MNYLCYLGTAIGIMSGLYYFRNEICDCILLYKATRNENKNNITIDLYDTSKVKVHTSYTLKSFQDYKRDYPTLLFIEINYKHNNKEYSVIFDKDFQFPLKIENELKGYKKEFLSCTSGDKDLTDRLNKLLGPNRDFYKSFNLEIPVKYISDKKINCTDNELNEYILDITDVLH